MSKSRARSTNGRKYYDITFWSAGRERQEGGPWTATVRFEFDDSTRGHFGKRGYLIKLSAEDMQTLQRAFAEVDAANAGTE
jgi:hypothetical protein